LKKSEIEIYLEFRAKGIGVAKEGFPLKAEKMWES